MWKNKVCLLESFEGDRDPERRYDNICGGSKITADVYLRRLGFLCTSRSTFPSGVVQPAKSDERWSYNFLIDLVTELEREGKTGSYIESNVKNVKSLLSHNGLQVVGKIKLRGASDAPTLRDKDAPTSSEQTLLISMASTRMRRASVLMLEAGLIVLFPLPATKEGHDMNYIYTYRFRCPQFDSFPK